jgi:hypothetical protein
MNLSTVHGFTIKKKPARKDPSFFLLREYDIKYIPIPGSVKANIKNNFNAFSGTPAMKRKGSRANMEITSDMEIKGLPAS